MCRIRTEAPDRSVDEQLHRRFRLSHDRGSLPSAPVISKPERHGDPLLGRQLFHQPPEMLELNAAQRGGFNLGIGIRQPVGQLPAHRLVTEMVGQRIAGDPVEPAGKGTTAVAVPADPPKRLEEDVGRYVFRRRDVTESCVRKAVDIVRVAVIEDAECLGITLRSLDEKALILVHAWSLGRRSGRVIMEFTDCEEGDRWWGLKN